MDSKELRGLVEAYQQVNAPIDEAEKPFPHEKVKAKQVALRDKGGNALDRRMKMGMAVRRAKEAEKTGGSQRDAGKGWYHAKEELDIFDAVLEFLQVNGYAETLEEAEWMMANLIDEEAVAIILGEAEKPFPHEKVKAKQVALRDKGGNALDRRMKMGMAVRRAKEAEKTGGSQRDAGKGWYHAREEFELWVNELVEEGYDLSDYTWDEMYEFYLDEDSRRMSNKQKTANVRQNIKAFGSNFTPPNNYDPDANRGKGEVLTRKQIEKKRRKSLRQEEFEAWLDEADSIAAMRERAAKRRQQRYGKQGGGGRDDFRPYTKADYERGEANDPRKKK